MSKDWKKIGDRPSAYAIHPQSSFNFKYVEMAARLTAAGFSLKDIGYAFGMSARTISTWSEKHPQFKRALEEGRSVAKSHVVAKALKAACGYEYTETNEKYYPSKTDTDDDGSPVMILKDRSVFNKHQAPNPKLIMWLLCNLDPDTWKSEHKILVGKEETIHIKLDGKMASKQIEALAGKLMDSPMAKPKKKIIEIEETRNAS